MNLWALVETFVVEIKDKAMLFRDRKNPQNVQVVQMQRTTYPEIFNMKYKH